MAKARSRKPTSSTNSKQKRLYRSGKEKMIAGICGGLAEYLNTDPTFVRLVWVILSILTGVFTGVIAYILAWAIIPRNPNQSWDN